VSVPPSNLTQTKCHRCTLLRSTPTAGNNQGVGPTNQTAQLFGYNLRDGYRAVRIKDGWIAGGHTKIGVVPVDVTANTSVGAHRSGIRDRTASRHRVPTERRTANKMSVCE
jgi:hypothetical protein